MVSLRLVNARVCVCVCVSVWLIMMWYDQFVAVCQVVVGHLPQNLSCIGKGPYKTVPSWARRTTACRGCGSTMFSAATPPLRGRRCWERERERDMQRKNMQKNRGITSSFLPLRLFSKNARCKTEKREKGRDLAIRKVVVVESWWWQWCDDGVWYSGVDDLGSNPTITRRGFALYHRWVHKGLELSGLLRSPMWCTTLQRRWVHKGCFCAAVVDSVLLCSTLFSPFKEGESLCGLDAFLCMAVDTLSVQRTCCYLYYDAVLYERKNSSTEHWKGLELDVLWTLGQGELYATLCFTTQKHNSSIVH